MKSIQTGKIYKSPVKKLVRFFEKSRDQWKAKCRAAKAVIKYLKNRVRFLEMSRDRWKRRAKEWQRKVVQMETTEREWQEKLAILRQKEAEVTLASSGLEDFALIARHHQYSVGHVMLFTSLVLSEAASLRCASRVMERMLSFLRLPLSAPSWFAGRLWLLRLGYYKLTRPKPQANDWVWLVDHTVQLGNEKCLVILSRSQFDIKISCSKPKYKRIWPKVN